MKQPSLVLKGDILYARDDKTLAAVKDGFLVCEAGRSAGVYPVLPERFVGLPVTDWSGRLMVPGLVDLHVHAPQYMYRALGMDLELLPWLQTYTFPAESRYAVQEFAQKAYASFVRDLRASATTRAAVFATIHVEATELLMEQLEASGLQTLVGKVNMDRNSIPALTEGTEESARETLRWLEETAGRWERTKPILTPRFIPSCTDELMARLGEIQRQYALPVQSHLSENRAEVAWVRELCPQSSCYGDAYARFGLFGKGVPTIMAHCVHPTPEEFALLKDCGVTIAHCPQSNMNICSGAAPVRAYLDAGLNVGLGSDVAGGAELSIFSAMRDAIHTSKLRWALQDDSLAPLTAAEAFYLGTKGGGAFWGQAGGFDEGDAFDALVIDDSRFDALEDYSAPEQRLERVIYLSNEGDLVAKYCGGTRLF